MRTIGSKGIARLLPSAMLALLASSPASAQRGGAPQPVTPPGPSVVGHWAGKAVPVPAQADYQAVQNFDLRLTQEGNDVTGTLTLLNAAGVPGTPMAIKGIEQAGRMNLNSDTSPVEHRRMHMTVANDALVGEVWNFHDQPDRWSVDSDRTFVLKKVP